MILTGPHIKVFCCEFCWGQRSSSVSCAPADFFYYYYYFSFVFFSAQRLFRHKNVSEKPNVEKRTNNFFRERNIYVNHDYQFSFESEHGLLTSRIYFQFQHCSMRPPKKKCIVLSPTAPIQTNKPAIFDQLCHAIEIILHYRVIRWHRSL